MKGAKVILRSYGEKKVSVIKVVKDLIEAGMPGQLALADAKKIVESAPCVVAEYTNWKDATDLEDELRNAGAIVDLEFIGENETDEGGAPSSDEFLALLDKCREQVEAFSGFYTANPHLYELQHRIYLRLCGGNIPAHGVDD